MPLLKLLALDKDDLTIISAYVQDAVLKVKNIDWQPENKRFVMVINRFAWENEKPQKKIFKMRASSERHFAALHFDRVEKVQVRGLSKQNTDEVLSLLAIQFKETENPSGIVELQFSGDCILRLQVECIECQLADLGPVWQAKNRPLHD